MWSGDPHDIVNVNRDHVHDNCAFNNDALPIAGPLSEPLISSVSSQLLLPQFVSIFYDNVARSQGVGICTSCFSAGASIIQRLLYMHGIEVNGACSVTEMQYHILRHLLLDDCMRTSEANSNLPIGSCCNIACSQLCAPFASATNMSVSFIRCVVDDLSADQKLNGSRLSAIASAILNNSFLVQAFSTPSNVRRDTLCLLKHILAGETQDDSHILPSDIENMTKSELQTFAHSHAISFECKTSVANLWNLILIHILSVQCLWMVNVDNWDQSPSGCSRSMRLLLSEGCEPVSTSFIVFTLSNCAQSMSLKPLQHVLTHLGVPFNLIDSLNQLRR